MRGAVEFITICLVCAKRAGKNLSWVLFCLLFFNLEEVKLDRRGATEDRDRHAPLGAPDDAGKGAGDSRRNHHRIALGSAAEVAAIIDITDFPDAEQRRGEVRRVGAMLAAMSRR